MPKTADPIRTSDELPFVEVSMGLKARILKVVQLENGGPRKRSVLDGMARVSRQGAKFDEIFKSMLARSELVMYSDKRFALYGPPGLRRRRGGWVVQTSAPAGR